MKVRVTQADIARAAGVHNTTVSLALRNSPLIPPATRDRIRAIAKARGYSPDPALQALVAYRRTRLQQQTGETLAYVTHWETRWGWRRHPAHEAHYLAAARKAAELGYRLEHFGLGEDGLGWRRFNGVLLHRGIRGLVLGAARSASEDLSDLDWSRLAAVRLGGCAQVPALNRITVDPAAVVRLALQHVLYAGYRRVGLVLPHHWDKLTDQAWSAAFHAEQYRCHLKDVLPVLRLQGPLAEDSSAPFSPHDAANDAALLLRWSRQYRPEVVLGTSPAILDHLRRSGFQVPGDFAYADLALAGPDTDIAGVWTDATKAGELAVEMLAGQLQQNLCGLPTVPTVTSLGGAWCDGSTLPAKRPAADSPALSPDRRNLVA